MKKLNFFREDVCQLSKEMPISFSLTECGGCFDLNIEQHEEFQILYVQKGKATFLVNGQKILLSAEQALMIRSGIPHSNKPVEAYNCVYMVFLLDYGYLYNEGIDMIRTHYILPIMLGKIQIAMLISDATALGHQSMELIREMVSYRDYLPPYYEIRVRSILYQLLYNLLECDEPENPVESDTAEQRIEQIVSYLHSNYQVKITVDELAARAYMSRENFFRYFKKEMGCSPMEYLKSLRIRQVKDLLKKTNMSLQAIADQCGFSSVNYMIRVFKKAKGMTPEQYRIKRKYEK